MTWGGKKYWHLVGQRPPVMLNILQYRGQPPPQSLNCVCVCLVTLLCPILCDIMDCSLPGSSVHRIFQAWILEWVAMPFSRGSSWPRDQTHISCIGRWMLYHWATRETQSVNYMDPNVNMKNWCFLSVMLEKTLESPLDWNKIQPVNPKGTQPWIFTGRTDAEVEAPILGPPDAKSWLIRKDPDTGKDWRQEEKETIEDEMIGRHHRLNGRVWASSRRWWTGKPGVLQSMESQWVQHDWATEEHQQRSIMLRLRKTTVEEYRSPGIIRTSNFLCPWSLRGPLGAI